MMKGKGSDRLIGSSSVLFTFQGWIGLIKEWDFDSSSIRYCSTGIVYSML